MPSQCEKSLDIPRLSGAYFRFIHRKTISRYLSIQVILTVCFPLTCFSFTVKTFPPIIEFIDCPMLVFHINAVEILSVWYIKEIESTLHFQFKLQMIWLQNKSGHIQNATGQQVTLKVHCRKDIPELTKSLHLYFILNICMVIGL